MLSQQVTIARIPLFWGKEISFSSINSNKWTKETLEHPVQVNMNTAWTKYWSLLSKVEGFSNLPMNWDGYDADQVSINAIAEGRNILFLLNINNLISGVFDVNVFPMRDGGIQFEFDADNAIAELEIDTKGQMAFIIFNSLGDIIWKLKIYELNAIPALLQLALYENEL